MAIEDTSYRLLEILSGIGSLRRLYVKGLVHESRCLTLAISSLSDGWILLDAVLIWVFHVFVQGVGMDTLLTSYALAVLLIDHYVDWLLLYKHSMVLVGHFQHWDRSSRLEWFPLLWRCVRFANCKSALVVLILRHDFDTWFRWRVGLLESHWVLVRALVHHFLHRVVYAMHAESLIHNRH